MTVSTKNFDRMKISEIENGVTLAENAALSKKVKVLNQCKLFLMRQRIHKRVDGN